MADPDFGTCLSLAGGDIDTRWRRVSGRPAVAQAIANRFQTPTGSLWWAPGDGYDLRALLSESLTTSDVPRIQSRAAAECEKDERVLGARAQVTLDAQARTMRVVLQLELADGPFRLVFGVSAVSVTILEAQ